MDAQSLGLQEIQGSGPLQLSPYSVYLTGDSISKNVILLSMKRISIELNATLNKKLKKYIHAHYESAFGKQEIVLHDALVEFLNAHGTSQPQVEEIDEVLTPAELGTQQTEPATSHSAESTPATGDAAGASAQPKAKRVRKPPKAKKTPTSAAKESPPKPD